jgi:pilus assembly protein FimV
LQDKASADKVAHDRAAKDAATRVAELNKNIADLNKLGAVTPGAAAGGASAAKPGVAVPVGAASAAKPASAPAAAPIAAASAAKPVASAPAAAAASAAPVMAAASSAPVPAAAVVGASAPASAAMAAAPVATSASAPASAASAAATPAPAPAAAVKPAAAASKPKAAPAETTLVEDLMANPIVPASIFGILVALVGFVFYRSQQRKKSTQVDSSFLESRLQPDSFFGASGGQRIDTNEGGSQTGSSMVYSPSQLDAAGDVDPVAEADVYLAYGRDLQAEEILKEAMRTTPQRVAVHSKLLEIYAKRRDAKAFELVATEAYGLTHGNGPEWEHIVELGHELDSSNPLYRPGGQPTEGTVAAAAVSTASGNFGSTTATPAYQPPSEAAAGPDSNVDLDLDLDFSIGDDVPGAPPAPVSSASAIANQATQKLMAPPVAEPPEPAPVLDMDFGSATVSLEAPAAQPARLDVPDLTLNENSLNFDPTPVKAAAPVAAAPAPTADPGMIEFDLGSLSLDLPGATAPKAAAAAVAASEPDTESPSTSGGEDSSGDPLATKLALAQEFNAIGDPDGARSLAQEVIAEASGDLKSKAQRFLAEIG